MRISIAMATYNGQSFLREQLDTLAEQTLPPLELVVTDDGSTDGTLEILAEFARRAPFAVHLHRNSNRLGYRENFLACAGRCAGDYVAFCDQDDLWHAEKLARVAAAFKASPGTMLVVHQGCVVDAANEPTGAFYPRVRRRSIEMQGASRLWLNIPGFAMVFDARLVKKIPYDRRLPDPIMSCDPMAHDQWIYLLAGALGSISFLPDNLVRYRRHADNTTSQAPRPDSRASMLLSLRRSIATGREHYQTMQTVMVDYQHFFMQLAERSAGFSSPVEAAAERFGNLIQAFALRATLYSTGAGLFIRLNAFRRLLLGGYYSPRCFGSRSLLKDLMMAATGLGNKI